MTLEQIDQALTEWQARLAAAGDSLLELDDSAAYQRLRGTAERPAVKLTGITLARIGPALSVIDSLWQSQQQLTEIINQAQSLRPALGHLWARDSERRQIEFLLFGASVRLASAEAPFAQRGLLSTAEPVKAITLEQLLAQMTQNFSVVKSAVLEVGNAWDRLGQTLAAADREAALLQLLADQLGVDLRLSLENAQREITVLHERVSIDPLGAGTDFASSLNTFLAQTRTQLTALEQQRVRLDAGLRRAHALLAEIDTLQQACRMVQTECLAKIEAAATAVPQISPELPSWLQSVEAARQNQQWKPAQIGLERWQVSAESARTALTDFLQSGKAALERREELRGLLRALQAKAGAKARRNAQLDARLPALALEAEKLLHGRPTPLDQASALVTGYERLLAG